MRNSDQAFTLDVFPKRGVAGAKYDKISRKVQTINVLQTNEAIRTAAILIYPAEHNSGQLGMLRIKKTVRSEMDNLVLPYQRVGCCFSVRLKAFRNHARATRNHGHDRICFFRCVSQPHGASVAEQALEISQRW